MRGGGIVNLLLKQLKYKKKGRTSFKQNGANEICYLQQQKNSYTDQEGNSCPTFLQFLLFIPEKKNSFFISTLCRAIQTVCTFSKASTLWFPFHNNKKNSKRTKNKLGQKILFLFFFKIFF